MRIISAYAGQVVRNHLRDMFVSNVRRARTELSLEAPNDSGASIADAVGTKENTRLTAETEETRRLIDQVLATLPERPRKMVEGFMDGQTFREIGAARGMAPQNAQKIVANGLKVIRVRLKAMGVGGAEGGILFSGAENQLSETGPMSSGESAKIAQNYVEEKKIPSAKRHSALDDIDRILRAAGEEQLDLHGYQSSSATQNDQLP